LARITGEHRPITTDSDIRHRTSSLTHPILHIFIFADAFPGQTAGCSGWSVGGSIQPAPLIEGRLG
jgi:hypothetical protein